jgi:hypothetical protein
MTQPKHDESTTKQPVDSGDKPVGDNRRAGDQDGNQADGGNKSPGAAEATEDRKPDPLH